MKQHKWEEYGAGHECSYVDCYCDHVTCTLCGVEEDSAEAEKECPGFMNGLSELEREFQKVVEKASAKIEEQIKIARQAIDKAVKISEKYGVPFYSGITPLGMSYTPSSFFEKFDELSSEFVEDKLWFSVSEYEGWEHSSIC